MIVSSPQLSDRGVAFIACFEGFRAVCYDDAASPPNCTIGYGHELHPGQCTDADRRLFWTRMHGLQVLRQDARQAEDGVARYIRVPLTRQQTDALVSFAYNCGPNALAGDVGRVVNSRPARPFGLARWRWKLRVREALDEYVHAGNVVLAGLVRRRRAEWVLFAFGFYRRPWNPYV